MSNKNLIGKMKITKALISDHIFKVSLFSFLNSFVIFLVNLGSQNLQAGVIGGGATSSTWIAPSGTFSNASSLTSSYTPSISSGSVTLTLTTNDPDGAGPCTAATSTVVISITPGTPATYTMSPASGNMCAPGNINFSSILPTGTTFDWISGPAGYTFPTGFTTPSTTNTSLTGLPAGTYCVDITSPNVSGALTTTTLLSENFETGATGWTINNSGGNNQFLINNVYLGGTCTVGGTPFNVPAVPNQGAWSTAGINSKYLHIRATTTCGFTCAEGGAFPPLNANFCSTISDQKFTMNTSLNTVGKTNVILSFYWLNKGSDADDKGVVEYSINGGTNWIQSGSSLIGQTNWTLATMTNPAWDNQPNLLFRFRWLNDGSASSDPPLCLDEIKITAQQASTASCGTTVTECFTINPNTTPTFTQVAAICSGGTFTLPTTSNNSITGTWSPDSICLGTTIVLSADTSNLPTGSQYYWNFGNATVLSGSGAGPWVLQVSSAGSYNFVLDSVVNQCKTGPYNITTVVLDEAIA